MTRLPHEISVVGTSTRITGRISGTGGLRIEGTVKGDVNVNGDTELAEGASVMVGATRGNATPPPPYPA